MLVRPKLRKDFLLVECPRLLEIGSAVIPVVVIGEEVYVLRKLAPASDVGWIVGEFPRPDYPFIPVDVGWFSSTASNLVDHISEIAQQLR